MHERPTSPSDGAATRPLKRGIVRIARSIDVDGQFGEATADDPLGRWRLPMTQIDEPRPEHSLSLDQALDVLGDQVRRQILVALDEQLHVQNEFESDRFGPSDTDGEDLTLELHHYHLPKLEEFGLVDWERKSGRISQGERFEEIRPLLELLDENRERLPGTWS